MPAPVARTKRTSILLNTCSIREKAAEKVFSELGRLRPLKEAQPEMVLGVCGCVAQQEGERIFARAPFVDLVVGTRATGTLARRACERLRRGDRGAARTCDTAVAERFDPLPLRRGSAGRGRRRARRT